MIPLRLELKNFMSYGEHVTPLDLQGIHVACISGDNGNGKSALLDAITWALWGEARAPADELIRLGADEMRVVFDFQLGDDIYRVIRGRSKKSSSSVWELFIADNPDKAEKTNNYQSRNSECSSPVSPNLPIWRSLTGQGIRDTGRMIRRILRMDYRTFINSAYIQQGRADEFTKQTVTDRKKILADILDLSRYDILEQKAKERRNQAEQLIQELSRDIESFDAELASEASLEQQLEESKAEQILLEKDIASKELLHRKLQKKRADLDAVASQRKQIEDQISKWHAEIENLETQKFELERRIARFQETILNKERIQSDMEKLTNLKAKLADFDKRLEEFRKFDVERMRFEQAFAGERHKLELELQSYTKELQELGAKVAQLPAINEEVARLRAKMERLDKLEARRSVIQSEITSLSDRMGELKALRDRLVEEKQDLEEKLKLLSEPGAQCPVCQTELGVEKRAEIVKGYEEQVKEKDSVISTVISEASDIKKRRTALENEHANLENELKNGMEIRRRLAQAEHTQFQLEEMKKQEPELRKRIEALERKLDSKNFAHDLQAKIKGAIERISALNYSEDEHTRIKNEISSLKEIETLAATLKVAEESLPAAEANLKAINELIASRQQSIVESGEVIKNLEKLLSNLDSVQNELDMVTRELQQLREKDKEITGRIATLMQSINRCKTIRAQAEEKRKQLEKAKRDKALYNDLVVAFGKKGVQALIIENAIPEIQDEANRLLAQMTDNAMQVSLETIRDKKTGGTSETLDIKISDDMGTRSYELYSGGEAFRVNFALRIALSRLLARRAGARLQTLIIDEGFGTQDGKGREKLVEAINSIKDDFEKILVITHIDELKDAFPTRIEITKDSRGSQINIC